MEMKYYIRLPNNTHKEVKQEEYTKAFSNKMRIVKQTQVGSILVSTVFLGIDLEPFKKSEEPMLYETMVFGGVYSDTMQRSKTHNEALEAHKQAVKLVKTTGWFYSFIKIIDDLKKNTTVWLNSDKPKEKK